MKKNLTNGLAVRGFDLVSIVDTKRASRGKAEISFKHDGAEYRFKSEENKQRFRENPSRYIPEYGGFCAIAMSEGALVDANPKSFILQDDKLFVFFSKYFGLIDTRRQWAKDPIGLNKLADTEWEGLNEE